MRIKANRIFAIPDTHFPWASREGLCAAMRLLKSLGFNKDDVVIQLGDLKDFFCFGRYPKSLNVLTPEQEVTRGRAGAERMWLQVQEITKARCVQIKGNHDDRLEKRVLETLPELVGCPGVSLGESLFTFPGVTTVHDSKEELFVTQNKRTIVVTHGHRRFGEHARFNQASTINGHLHTGAVAWFRNAHGPYFELNAGFMGDIKSPAFAYRSQRTIHTSTVGIGLVDELGPRFIPLT